MFMRRKMHVVDPNPNSIPCVYGRLDEERRATVHVIATLS